MQASSKKRLLLDHSRIFLRNVCIGNKDSSKRQSSFHYGCAAKHLLITGNNQSKKLFPCPAISCDSTTIERQNFENRPMGFELLWSLANGLRSFMIVGQWASTFYDLWPIRFAVLWALANVISAFKTRWAFQYGVVTEREAFGKFDCRAGICNPFFQLKQKWMSCWVRVRVRTLILQ